MQTQQSEWLLRAQTDRDILKDVVDRQALQLDRAATACRQLQEGHKHRVGEARRVRHVVEQVVNQLFNNFLKRRRHSGRIVLNYEEQKLEMEVRVPGRVQIVNHLAPRMLAVQQSLAITLLTFIYGLACICSSF